MPNHELRTERCVDEYADVLLRHATLRVQDVEVAKDLVQDTFFTAMRGKDSYRGEISEKNWLFLILKSRILDHFKKKREVLESQLKHENEEESQEYFYANGHWTEEAGPIAWNPSRMSESNEFMEILRICMNRLQQLQQMVFRMKYLDEEESEMICKELDISSSNFWVLIHRAKLQLRKCLDTNWIKA